VSSVNPSPGRNREAWGTRIGVILAVTGGAVGLGNFLRFPGLAAKYEGGAFMVPYFTALLLLGLPLAWAEWALGRYGGGRGFNSGPGIFRALWPSRTAAYLGTLVLIVPVLVYMYYVFIEAWCLGYAWHMATGQLDLGLEKSAYIDFFARFVGARQDGALFTSDGLSSLGFLAICLAANLWLIYRGLSKGIEWFCRWAMPALVLCALAVLVRVLTLGTPDPAQPELNLLNGLGFMWNPRTEQVGFLQALANPKMWIEAASQIFFSVAIGFGIIITYASYLKPDDDIALSGLTSVAGNEFCEVALGGMITIPAAFIFLGRDGALAIAGSTFDLGFKTLPMIFHSMPLGRAVGTLFFFLLFLAAVTSSIAMLQPAIALFEEGLGLSRRRSVALLGVMTLAGVGFVVYFTRNLVALDTIDFWVGTLAIYLLATVQTILFGWFLGMRRGMEELDRGAEIRIPRLVGFVIKYVSPVYLLGVFALWLYQQITATEDNFFLAAARSPAARGTVAFILAMCLTLLALVHLSLRRWERAERGPSRLSRGRAATEGPSGAIPLPSESETSP